MKMLLVGFREVFIAGMSQRIDDHHRLHPFDDQSRQSFAGCHGNFANRVRVKPHGGPERQSIFLLIENIKGADFGLHTISHGGDDTVQGFLDIMGMADEGADILKDRKVRLCFSHGSDSSCHENVDGTEPKYYSKTQI